MKKRIYKLLCVFCAATVIISCVTLDGSALSDKPTGKMASVYAYILNDYMGTYGVISTPGAGGAITGENGGAISPTGVICGDIVDFDANENPYLAIFIADGRNNTASCHIWKYNEATEEAEKIAALDKNYGDIPADKTGGFNIGWNDKKRYITYREYNTNGEPVNEEFYTVLNGDTLMYVYNPTDVSESEIMNFNAYSLRPMVDVSYFNEALGNFFNNLKNTAADSVTYEDISEKLYPEDEGRLEKVLSKAVALENFDIADFDTLDKYKAALNEPSGTNRFYLITNMYNLGDEIYYVRFSTDMSFYNYALLRRSDTADSGYQILNVSTDCIPLSDRELKQIKDAYSRNTLLYKRSKGTLKVDRSVTDFLSGRKESNKPVEIFGRTFDPRLKIPIACISGGIVIALLTILWAYIYGNDD